MQILCKLFQNKEEAGVLPSSSFEDVITLLTKPYKDIIGKENYRPVSFMNIDAKKNPQQNTGKLSPAPDQKDYTL